MPMTNYPDGFASGISIRGVPLVQTHPGATYWVSNNTTLSSGEVAGSDGNPGTFNRPFATLDYAIGRCRAGKGDIIFVKPGHSENLATAGAITADVAGIAIVGLGSGSNKPQFNWTAAAATLAISAANITFFNLDFVANFADVTTMFNVTAGGYLTFANCNFLESGTDLNMVDCITVATGLSGFDFVGCNFIGNDTANDSFLTGAGTINRLTMQDCYLAMTTAQAAVVGLIETVGNATNVRIRDCDFVSNVDGALFLDFNGAANSGVVADCNFSSADIAGAVTAGFDFTGGHMFECYVAGEADSYGIIGGGTIYNNA